ncbi:MAG: sigma-70 family RNA polymerase sigma factor [Thermomicrobium sp.]|nr:sigma-70 family RNA polymerase sigma factor [Thermomicrobium sp.]MDW7981526.1 sigma-70 family RNA polymerase sigma factor [Thermomicrobium sp.]
MDAPVTVGDTDQHECTEEALLAAARQCPEAFAELYLRYLGPVYRYLLARTGDQATAEDLTQETFLRAYRALDRYQPRGIPVLAWFLRIARNVAIDAARRATAERVRLRLLPSPSFPARETAEDRILVEQLLHGLSPEKRELLALRFAAGLSTAEIAALLGKREGAIRKQLFRIVRELREAYRAMQTE